MSKYITELLSYPSLSRKEMFNLAKIYQVSNDEEQKQACREKLIKAFSKVSVKYAIYYAEKTHSDTYHHVVEDLVAAGIEGICKAIDKYNPDMGVHFYVYVKTYVQRAVFWESVRLKSLIHLPTNATALDPDNHRHQVPMEDNLGHLISSDNPCVESSTNIAENTILDTIAKHKHGKVIWLSFVDQLTHKQIAERTGFKVCRVIKILKTEMPGIREELKSLKEEVLCQRC